MKIKTSIVICCICILALVFSSCQDSDTKLSAEEIYEKVSPSVVTITAESPSAVNSGTGFFYKDGSTVVTNYHVIQDCSTASITLINGKKYDVLTVLGYDESKDIAILKADYKNGIPLKIRTSEVKTGESVYAIGNSLGFLDGSLSEGIVSTAKRDVDGQTYIQTTASVTHGNSGGPLIDSYGKVVGIVSAGFGDGLDLNLAIPSSELNTIDLHHPKTLQEVVAENLSKPHNILAKWIVENAQPVDFSSLGFGIENQNGFHMEYHTNQYSQLVNIVYYPNIQTFAIYMRDFSNGYRTMFSFELGTSICNFVAIDYDQNETLEQLVVASGVFDMLRFDKNTQLVCEEYNNQNEYFDQGMAWYQFEPIYRSRICDSLECFEFMLEDNQIALSLQDIGFVSFGE